jgi:hypothetical protein
MARNGATRLTITNSPTSYSVARGRRFALTLFIAFAILALIAAWRQRETVLLIFGSLAAAFAIAGLAAPASLGPVERAWMSFAHALSRITTPIFMGIVYFVILAPVGLVRRAAGRNALVREAKDDSYWITRAPSESEKMRRRMERQF